MAAPPCDCPRTRVWGRWRASTARPSSPALDTPLTSGTFQTSTLLLTQFRHCPGWMRKSYKARREKQKKSVERLPLISRLLCPRTANENKTFELSPDGREYPQIISLFFLYPVLELVPPPPLFQLVASSSSFCMNRVSRGHRNKSMCLKQSIYVVKVTGISLLYF